MKTDHDCREIVKAAVDVAKIAEKEAVDQALREYTGYLSTLGLVSGAGTKQDVYEWQEILEEYLGILVKESK